jgi:hypothetical protein
VIGDVLPPALPLEPDGDDVLPPALPLEPDGDDAPPPEFCDDDVDEVLPAGELEPPGLPPPADCWVVGSEIGEALPPPLLLELVGDDGDD